MTQELSGKLALVTGAGTGIGREIALEFARQGAALALHYSHSDKGAKSAVAEILAGGGRAQAFQADLRDIPATQKMAGLAVEFLGGLDILVNNAGITMNRPFAEVTPEQFDTLYQVNVRGQFFLTQAVLPVFLKRGGGVIINLTSIHALEGFTEHSVYAGTKGAIISYTRQLAIELAPKGIRVNAIAPGAIPVESHQRAAPGSDTSAIGKLIPCGFPGTPLDIARLAVFLASEKSRYIVGQTIVADGGTTAWLPFCEGFRQPMTAQFGVGYVPGL
jgi:NAD(P)-dependent dehydrogenase (short-subunit alcohol dehydrogenase family)